MDKTQVQERPSVGRPPLNVDQYEAQLIELINQVRATPTRASGQVERLLLRWAQVGNPPLSKGELVRAYRLLCERGKLPFERETLRRLQMKPIRTSSGVAPVTVLTKPYPCPGKCIFCPDDVRMPKSYLPDEPGAMRAAAHNFDPYGQTAGRIQAFESIGHSTAKVELLILGGTWSVYPRSYQEWFVKRCVDAMNGVEAGSLEGAQRINEQAQHRNVGLVIETRPDWVTPDEAKWLRRLGVTKVQLGAQSLNDDILLKNKRGHTVEQTRQAVRLLRLAGFKVLLHWMPNLFGATPESDMEDFRRLWEDPALRPDELKIYPTSLLRGTELYEYWEQGLYRPYTDQKLVELLVQCKQMIPRYCRLNRLMRDISAGNIVAGCTRSNLRQIVQQEMAQRGRRCQCIRCREVRRQKVVPSDLRLEVIPYATDVTQEYFLSFVTPDDRLAGFLRLSLPNDPANTFIEELRGSAMIREVHVYGPALGIGSESEGEAQHLGIGTRLIEEAKRITREHSFERLAVIAAIGTRAYYRERGFERRELYMHAVL